MCGHADCFHCCNSFLIAQLQLIISYCHSFCWNGMLQDKTYEFAFALHWILRSELPSLMLKCSFVFISLHLKSDQRWRLRVWASQGCFTFSPPAYSECINNELSHYNGAWTHPGRYGMRLSPKYCLSGWLHKVVGKLSKRKTTASISRFELNAVGDTAQFQQQINWRQVRLPHVLHGRTNCMGGLRTNELKIVKRRAFTRRLEQLLMPFGGWMWCKVFINTELNSALVPTALYGVIPKPHYKLKTLTFGQ